jgi:hypothetical protein
MIKLQARAETLYDTDYCLWLEQNIGFLQSRQFGALDLINLIEELSDLGKRDRRKLKNLLRQLLQHLLKLRYWQAEYENNQAHWRAEITNFRSQIRDELMDSPSLRHYLMDTFAECYTDARELASVRSQLPIDTFPEIPIADLNQVLDKHWWPGSTESD